MEKGEDLTKEELSFLYELDRPIATLDTYNEEDPRIPELKEKYGIEYALEKGVDANMFVSNLKPNDVVKNLDSLLNHGADANNVVSKMDHYGITKNLDTLLEHGADIDVNKLVSSLRFNYIAKNLGTLLKHGADVNNVIKNLDEEDIKNNIDLLRKYGAKLDTYQGNN